MDQWDEYIPPLNLWNYNSYWHWAEELLKEESQSDPINED